MKWIGALLIVAGCGGTGLALAAAYHREERMLEQLLEAVSWMQCELRCRTGELSYLFRRLEARSQGMLAALFAHVHQELSMRVAPDAQCCMDSALQRTTLPPLIRQAAYELGTSLGEFDLQGQLMQMDRFRTHWSRILDEHREKRDNRVRSYRTLGLCGGLVLAIVLF